MAPDYQNIFLEKGILSDTELICRIELIQCIEDSTERNYASVLVSKYQALNLKYEIQMHFVYRDHEQAEKLLLQSNKNTEKRYMDENSYVWRHIHCFVELSQLMYMK